MVKAAHVPESVGSEADQVPERLLTIEHAFPAESLRGKDEFREPGERLSREGQDIGRSGHTHGPFVESGHGTVQGHGKIKGARHAGTSSLLFHGPGLFPESPEERLKLPERTGKKRAGERTVRVQCYTKGSPQGPPLFSIIVFSGKEHTTDF